MAEKMMSEKVAFLLRGIAEYWQRHEPTLPSEIETFLGGGPAPVVEHKTGMNATPPITRACEVFTQNPAWAVKILSCWIDKEARHSPDLSQLRLKYIEFEMGLERAGVVSSFPFNFQRNRQAKEIVAHSFRFIFVAPEYTAFPPVSDGRLFEAVEEFLKLNPRWNSTFTLPNGWKGYLSDETEVEGVLLLSPVIEVPWE